MDQVYLVIISPEDGTIKLAQCFEYEFKDYSILPSKDGNPISFDCENTAKDWIINNVKNDLIHESIREKRKEDLRSKYLINP